MRAPLRDQFLVCLRPRWTRSFEAERRDSSGLYDRHAWSGTDNRCSISTARARSGVGE
jgi:hypothetical protein